MVIPVKFFRSRLSNPGHAKRCAEILKCHRQGNTNIIKPVERGTMFNYTDTLIESIGKTTRNKVLIHFHPQYLLIIAGKLYEIGSWIRHVRLILPAIDSIHKSYTRYKKTYFIWASVKVKILSSINLK